MSWAKTITICALIGVVVVLMSELFIIGYNSQNSNPVTSGVALGGGIAVIIFGLQLYFDKQTNKKLDEIKKILDRLDKK